MEQLEISEALYPPEGILSSSSLVLFSVSKDVEVSEWKNIMVELQAFFAEQGVDAVAYLDVNALYTKLGKSEGLPEVLDKRNIKNLIFFHYQGEEQTLFLAMGPLSDKEALWRKNDLFWTRSGTALAPIFQELDVYFKTGARKRTNLLVNDYPEYFQPKLNNSRIVISGEPRIREEYNVTLKDWDDSFYSQLGAHRFTEQSFESPENYKRLWKDRRQLMSAIAADTTNIIELVRSDATDREMQRLGYDYDLGVVFGNHTQLQQYFKTDPPIAEFDGIKVVYYMKSLTTNILYLPEDWQPQSDWDNALNQILDAYRHLLYPPKSE